MLMVPAMRKKILLICILSFGVTGCVPQQDERLRSREDRESPDPTLGTENPESQWYKTQILASPSAPDALTAAKPAAIPATNAPAKLGKVPVPTRPASPKLSEGTTPQGF